MAAPWMCPRCYELGRTPIRLVAARMDDPLNHSAVTVCLRCAEVLWRRLRKVLGPMARCTAVGSSLEPQEAQGA